MKGILIFFIVLLASTACTRTSPEKTFGPQDLIYFVMTDRFYDGDSTNNAQVDKQDPKKYHGGDFTGLSQKLDYIQGLGATALWITPVQDNIPDGYHGYWIDDFRKIEPSLGTMKALQTLSKEIHDRDMKLIVDFVVNHTGYDSTLLKEKPDWFHEERSILNYNDKEQVQNGWLAGLPDLDQSKPEVEQFLIDSALWLIEEVKIDGFRLDTVRHVDPEFWKKFTAAILAKYPDFYFLGEVYDFNASVVNYWKSGGIEGMLDYPMYKAMRETFRDSGSGKTLAKALETSLKDKTRHLNGLFIDNHDNKRFLSATGTNAEKYLKQALVFMMSSGQIPVIYYGTEVMMEGGDDPDNRRDFPWDQAENRLQPLWQKLLEMRNDPAFKAGSLELILAEQDYLVYQVSSETRDYLYLLNLRDEPVTVQLGPATEKALSRATYTSLLTARILEGNTVFELRLEPLEIEIFKGE